MPLEKKVMMTVWALANQDVYRKVANIFDTSRGASHRYIMEVCAAIVKYLKPKYIHLPTDAECASIASATESKFGIPGVCGFIDGTHIPVKPPAKDRDSFINRKGYPSINVLAVCDHKMRFTYVYADRAGSVHDARVLRVSTLGTMLETSMWPAAENFHLLGDSAYPLLPSLLVPFRDNGYLSATQNKFNSIHSAARSIVERGFGRLKGKFRRMKGIDATNLNYALEMIETAFVLHNFILFHELEGDDDDDDDTENQTEQEGGEISGSGQNGVRLGTGAMRNAAKLKRDVIAAAL
jgi:hypothetical protein